MPSLDKNMMREIIMDHYNYPRNKRDVNDDTYKKIHMDSTSCTDDIHVFVKLNGDKIEDVAFSGIACTIATSSTSIMSELVIGKTIDEAKVIIENYFKMINNEAYDEDILDEANAFKNTYLQPNRINCATIGWKALKQLIEEKEE